MKLSTWPTVDEFAALLFPIATRSRRPGAANRAERCGLHQRFARRIRANVGYVGDGGIDLLRSWSDMSPEITKVTSHINPNEALIFERSQQGRIGYRLPPLDVDVTGPPEGGRHVLRRVWCPALAGPKA